MSQRVDVLFGWGYKALLTVFEYREKTARSGQGLGVTLEKNYIPKPARGWLATPPLSLGEDKKKQIIQRLSKSLRKQRDILN